MILFLFFFIVVVIACRTAACGAGSHRQATVHGVDRRHFDTARGMSVNVICWHCKIIFFVCKFKKPRDDILADMLASACSAAEDLAKWRSLANDALANQHALEAFVVPNVKKHAIVRILRNFNFALDHARRLSDFRHGQWDGGVYLPFECRKEIGADADMACFTAINEVACPWFFMGTAAHVTNGVKVATLFNENPACPICMGDFKRPGWLRLLNCCNIGVCSGLYLFFFQC